MIQADLTRVQSLGWEDPLEKEMATTPVFLPGKSHGQRSLAGCIQYSWASLVAQLVNNPPSMQETWVRSLGWEDPLEKGKTTPSSTLA